MKSGAWSRPIFSLDLAAWRAMRRRHRDPLARGLALRFYLAGSALSALGALQARMYRQTLGRIELRPPLFIVGHWRSGTTLLHELLALDDRFAAPSTHACFNPHYFLLAQHRAPAAALVARPTGDVAVSPASPQEEEFALLCMGALSPYEAFMFPPALHQIEALSDPDFFEPPQQLRWNDAMTWFLKAIACVSGAERRLVVKSPANSFRVARLYALFPGAAFIRVVREPCAVFASSLRLWQSMWKRYALTPALAQEVLIERILETRLALERKLHDGLRALPAHRVATLRYEDLTADPRGTIALLYERIGLGDPSAMLPRVSEYMAQNRPPAPRPAEDWRALVESRWSALFDEFGYARG